MVKTKLVTKDILLFDGFAYTILLLFSLFCLLPFLLVLSGSVSSESVIQEKGFSLIPAVLSGSAYRTIFAVPQGILGAYGVTVFITLVGTAFGLFLSAMAAYVLQKKEFKYRNAFAFYFYFTTLFNGGLVPYYILMVRYMHMKNNILSLIIPLLFNAFYIIIIRSFISSTIPASLSESAKIDGAGEFRTFIQLIFPLSKPVLATIGLFIALNYWNDWFYAMLFIDKSNLFPLQYYLYRILSQIVMLRRLVGTVHELSAVRPPEETFKMAMTIVTIGPIIILYPYLQKFFIRGIVIGAVKG